MAVLNWQDVLRVHFIHKPSLYIYWYALYSPNIGNRVRIEGPPSKAMTLNRAKIVTSDIKWIEWSIWGKLGWKKTRELLWFFMIFRTYSKYQWSQWIPMVMLWSCVLMLFEKTHEFQWSKTHHRGLANWSDVFEPLRGRRWLFEKHMKGTIKVPTKRQNDKTTRIFLNFFTGSQPRGEVSLKFLTEEVMFFSYQHFDVTKWLKVRNEIPVDDMISGLSDLDNLDSWKPK